MPSAAWPLTLDLLDALRRRSIALARLTHAAGLSATGDPVLDALLPLPERTDVPEETVVAVGRAKASGNRVVAIGTTVVRALEGRVAEEGGLRAGPGVTRLRIGPVHQPRVVDGLLSGLHEPGESHFELLRAFAPTPVLEAAASRARAEGFRGHEFGDLCLILPGAPTRGTL
jgi:S-adenosylmethionine:tRNA ribosyltransferase-isomerase